MRKPSKNTKAKESNFQSVQFVDWQFRQDMAARSASYFTNMRAETDTLEPVRSVKEPK